MKIDFEVESRLHVTCLGGLWRTLQYVHNVTVCACHFVKVRCIKVGRTVMKMSWHSLSCI